TLKTILLLPDAKVDAKALARLAEVAMSDDKNSPWLAWHMTGKGLHDYRTGKYADAVAAIRASRERLPKADGDLPCLMTWNLTVEARALHRADAAAGAKRALCEARSSPDAQVPGIEGTTFWSDWLALRILYREAERLMGANPMKPN